ncbi:MAG: 2,3-bisphosphoglycerate-independent phosphoglycerate mutase [Candidatus Kerfeldbacteria bacterium]|nr:2,3-bisphosphoglycerate-independent phosphoglycerate mutase [Candidatus Kerfeldbacteria bacterium]
MNFSGPLVLVILDGWGVAPVGAGNAVRLANTPTIGSWQGRYPQTTLMASGLAVGLSLAQDGNSEAGHMNIGAGRRVMQDNVRISASLNDGTFFRNPAFLAAIQHVRQHRSTLHLMGMLGTNQSAHADPDHLLALLLLVHNHRLRRVALHLFTDGRDSPRYYAREMLMKFLPHFGDARVATIMGRFYAMDRNKNWDRTKLAYQALTDGQADHHVSDPLEAITQSYNRGESDEFVAPTIIGNYQGMSDGDAVIFFNLRSDRARQLAKTFVQPDFEDKNAPTGPFQRAKRPAVFFVAMTDFGPDLGDILTAYPAVPLTDTLPMVWGDRRQLYVAEGEKYAHVTYFFNGGYADPVAGEERLMIRSASERYFDRRPAMSTPGVTEVICQAVARRQRDVVVANFANTDMVAHTGNLQAGVTAMETADRCLGRVATTVLAANGLLVVTGDHGNLEEMLNPKTKEIDTEHSTNPVPLYLVSEQLRSLRLRPDGALGDIGPTLLQIMSRPIPTAMTGQSLLRP